MSKRKMSQDGRQDRQDGRYYPGVYFQCPRCNFPREYRNPGWDQVIELGPQVPQGQTWYYRCRQCHFPSPDQIPRATLRPFECPMPLPAGMSEHVDYFDPNFGPYVLVPPPGQGHQQPPVPLPGQGHQQLPVPPPGQGHQQPPIPPPGQEQQQPPRYGSGCPTCSFRKEFDENVGRYRCKKCNAPSGHAQERVSQGSTKAGPSGYWKATGIQDPTMPQNRFWEPSPNCGTDASGQPQVLRWNEPHDLLGAEDRQFDSSPDRQTRRTSDWQNSDSDMSQDGSRTIPSVSSCTLDYTFDSTRSGGNSQRDSPIPDDANYDADDSSSVSEYQWRPAPMDCQVAMQPYHDDWNDPRQFEAIQQQMEQQYPQASSFGPNRENLNSQEPRMQQNQENWNFQGPIQQPGMPQGQAAPTNPQAVPFVANQQNPNQQHQFGSIQPLMYGPEMYPELAAMYPHGAIVRDPNREGWIFTFRGPTGPENQPR